MLSRDLRNPWFLRDGIPEDSDRKTGQKWTWWRVGDPVRCQVDDRGKPLPARRSGRRIRRAMSSGLSKKRRGGTSGRFAADSREGGELAKKVAASIENPPPRLGCSRQLGLEPHGGVHNGRNTTVSSTPWVLQKREYRCCRRRHITQPKRRCPPESTAGDQAERSGAINFRSELPV